MAALWLLEEYGAGRRWQVWPEKDDIPPGRVHEAGNYLFLLEDCSAASRADLYLDDVALEPLRVSDSDSARWRWAPGFQSGLVHLSLKIPGGPNPSIEVATDPDLRKITRGDFDTMVREILEDTCALFALSSFYKGLSAGPGRKVPPIARLQFILSRMAELEQVILRINARPRHRLKADQRVLPWHQVRKVTGQEILNSYKSGPVLRQDMARSRLPAVLKGALPANIRVRNKAGSLDIPEHRQMWSCLRSWSSWLAAVASRIERATGGPDEETRAIARTWARRCRKAAVRTTGLLALPLFADIPEEQVPVRTSSTYRNDPLYRQFYRIWQDMNRGLSAVFGDFLNLPLSRTWELYELWCFLRLVRAASEEFPGDKPDTDDLFSRSSPDGITLASHSLSVSFSSGKEIAFQKNFQEFWKSKDGVGSYSRTMAPDITVGTLDTDKSAGLTVLDAKYRIDAGLGDAISSIHTYRDALVRTDLSGGIVSVTKNAFLISPYIPSAGDTTSYRASGMPDRLFRDDYQSSFGFGALTLKPGMPLHEIRSLARRLMSG